HAMYALSLHDALPISEHPMRERARGHRPPPDTAIVSRSLGPGALRSVKRLELAHILRAACDIAGDREILVLGSQSILGTFAEDDLPPAATASIEADIA